MIPKTASASRNNTTFEQQVLWSRTPSAWPVGTDVFSKQSCINPDESIRLRKLRQLRRICWSRQWSRLDSESRSVSIPQQLIGTEVDLSLEGWLRTREMKPSRDGLLVCGESYQPRRSISVSKDGLGLVRENHLEMGFRVVENGISRKRYIKPQRKTWSRSGRSN